MSSLEPLFSILTPVYNTPEDVLRQTIESVLAQRFTNWELILVDDGSSSKEVRSVLREAAERDGRVRVIERDSNGGISAASNDALFIARGTFLALLDHDDLLTPDALEVVAAAIEVEPRADYLYSDEDKVDDRGRYFDVFKKPEWSPERLRHQMYTCHLSVLRADLVRSVGGFRSAFDGSQDHDLVLRVTERAKKIVHIPKVLYHWRALCGSVAASDREKPHAWVAGKQAVQSHLDRTGISAVADFGPLPGIYSLKRSFPDQHRVSLVIPTRASTGMVWGEERCFVLEAVRSCITKTAHSNIEVVVIYDTDTPQRVLSELADIVPTGDLVLVPFEGIFNFSKKCNIGVLASSGEFIVLLNDDVQVVEDGWLEQLAAPLLEADVGLTGARLLFSDGTLQHGGHVYTPGGYHHAYYGAPRDELSEIRVSSSLLVSRECSGVTAACAALRREVFDEVGGFYERLSVNFNDVDFSLKISTAGYRILWMRNVVLYHFESKTRVPHVEEWEYRTVEDRWGLAERRFDPYLPDYP